MKSIGPTTRIAISIGISCAMLVWICTFLGLVQNPDHIAAEKRIYLTKGFAVNIAELAEKNRRTAVQKACEAAMKDDASIKSVGIIGKGLAGKSVIVGPHYESWDVDQENDARKQISVDVLVSGKKWGELQITFYPLHNTVWAIAFPLGPILFIFGASTLLAFTILSRTLKYLNPSKVVPNRVRSALDTLTEGLVLIDQSGKIAHANEAFRKSTGMEETQLLGHRLDYLNWTGQSDDDASPMPWDSCLNDLSIVTGQYVQLENSNGAMREFAVNATPIYNGQGSVRGSLLSFGDVTAIEQKNADLAEIIGSPRGSCDEMAGQNERLNFVSSCGQIQRFQV